MTVLTEKKVHSEDKIYHQWTPKVNSVNQLDFRKSTQLTIKLSQYCDFGVGIDKHLNL